MESVRLISDPANDPDAFNALITEDLPFLMPVTVIPVGEGWTLRADAITEEYLEQIATAARARGLVIELEIVSGDQ